MRLQKHLQKQTYNKYTKISSETKTTKKQKTQTVWQRRINREPCFFGLQDVFTDMNLERLQNATLASGSSGFAYQLHPGL